MKKSLIIICLIQLSLGITLKAQHPSDSLKKTTDPRKKFAFGVKGGFNYSNVWSERGEDFQTDPRFGIAGGLFFGIPIGKFLGVQPEILISQKGFQGAGTLFGSSYSFSRRSTYIDIPLQLQIKPAKFLTVVLGPQYSYLMHEKNVYTLGTTSTEQEQEFRNAPVRKNIFGFVTGPDIIIQHLVISGRVGWDLQNNNGDGTSSTPRYKNRWVQLTLGFKL
jgi:hypothetical protein